MAKRTSQLSASVIEPEPLESDVGIDDVVAAASVPVSSDPHADARRLQRLADGVRELRTGGGSLNLRERTLMILGGIFAPVGLVLVLIGWYGAAHTANLFEQIPYLISGGLFGLALVFLGAFCYFTHWLTELVKEQRRGSADFLEAITRLEDTIVRTSTFDHVNGATSPPSEPRGAIPVPLGDDVVLVATEKGTMAHRPECVVVVGKPGVHVVSPDEGLVPCKLCDPYSTVVN